VAVGITAVILDGPLVDLRIEVEPIEGRPPKTLDLPSPDGRRYRYCLAQWTQGGFEAHYEYLYPV
jgi:hypothetical protein